MRVKIEYKVLPFKEFLNFRKQIKTLPGELNRPIQPSHVTKMKSVMDDNGFDDVFKIIKTKIFSKSKTYEYYGGDGNHRLAGITELDLNGQDICLAILTINSLSEMISRLATWNNSQKKWTSYQYLNTWASSGNNDYSKLKEVSKKYKYSLPSLVEAFDKRKSIAPISYKKDFEEGKFIMDEEKGERLIRLYIDCILAGLSDSQGSFGAVVRFWNSKSDADPNIFIKSIQSKKYLFNNLTSKEIIQRELGNLYKQVEKSQSRRKKMVRRKTLNRMAEA